MKQVEFTVSSLNFEWAIVILSNNRVNDMATIVGPLWITNTEGLSKLVGCDGLVYRQLADVASDVAIFDDLLRNCSHILLR